MKRGHRQNGSFENLHGNKDAAREEHEERSGGVATMAPPNEATATEVMSMPVSDPCLAADQFEAQRVVIKQNLMAEHESTQKRLDEISIRLMKLGEPVTGSMVTLEPPKRRGGRPKGSKNKPKMVNGEAGDVRHGSTSEMVLRLVQKYAPNKKHGKTKAELTALKSDDPMFGHMKDTDLNTGLQANRPPKVQVPRIALLKNPNGGTRGGRYYALV